MSKHVRSTPLRRLAENIRPIRNHVVTGAVVAVVGGLFAPSAFANAAQTLGVGVVHNRNIAYHAVTDSKINANGVGYPKLSTYTRGKIEAAGVKALEADGPYPGSTELQKFTGNGANSTARVPGDGKSFAVWVMCADGKTALGGGFRLGADQGDAVAGKIQVTASEPTQIAKQPDGSYKQVYQPIKGDAAGSFKPNGWLVEVINSSGTDANVRPWIVCAKA
ncbi:MAG: hypothetical protein J2P24_10390 [Streptosporangiales bacterium]|nr:hypothetical protein [Streptosporangiales bacterium]MBO0889548.1 hypothetical protein [Acidothermales bacterium]